LSNQTNGAVKTLDDYFDVVATVLKGIATNLGQASTLFRDVPAPQFPTAFAFTLALTRKSGEPAVSSTWPDGIYFNPVYLTDGAVTIGPLKQTEVAVHECAHFVQNDNISDPAKQTLSWAYGYSNFVCFCAIGRSNIKNTE
jgi:hypothetical protein